jgi:hypothetical protein
MFRLSLQIANPEVVRAWRMRAGLTVGGAGVLSIGTLVKQMRALVPEGALQEHFIYMALAIAFVTALPLTTFPRVLSVSVAQLGFATSLMYLGYSLLGVFLPDYRLVLNALLILVAFVFIVIFSSGPVYYYKERSWSDLALGVGNLFVFIGLWLYPLSEIWR